MEPSVVIPSLRLRAAVAAVAILFTLFATVATPRANAPVVLDATGAVRGGRVSFDLAALNALPQARIVTTTPWTKGETTFEGVDGKAFIQAIGATGKTIKARALNDYAVEIPVEDFLTKGVIIATRMNGEAIPVRTNGPLWIMYPFDSDPALKTKTFTYRSIWQLRAIEVR
jgi:hypothetical protein